MSRQSNQRRRSTTISLLLLALIYLPASGAASHYCFDGIEPPVSIHFDNLSGHEDHEEETEQHLDLEKRVLDDNLVGKNLFDLELPPFERQIVLHINLVAQDISYIRTETSLPRSGVWHINPPLRAPPSIS